MVDKNLNSELNNAFDVAFRKFTLHFYMDIFSRFETREASLTAVETFCTEVIYNLGKPTIKEFADFVHISAANATHKVQNLIKKGYVVKVQNEDDKREYRLHLTERFYEYYNVRTDYMNLVLARIKERFSESEIETFTEMVQTIAVELMPEVGS
ncbi:MAG: MarR family transcriptional regulator [Ruminococcus sp.]|jgi:DNA-binding MarR family transcriptional regulator|nr:MarR family transcriptional regulator [Ruminococcus sp.]